MTSSQDQDQNVSDERGTSGDEWAAIGPELRQRDPERFHELLRIAREIVEIRRDPIAAYWRRIGGAWGEKSPPKA